MIQISCPHCGATGSISVPPREFVIVAPCPRCGELVVLYHEKVVAADRKILEHGSFEEKKQHVAEIIATFIDSFGLLPPPLRDGEGIAWAVGEGDEDEEDAVGTPQEDMLGAITEKDIRDFLHIDLKLIDKKEHFERFFGKLD